MQDDLEMKVGFKTPFSLLRLQGDNVSENFLLFYTSVLSLEHRSDEFYFSSVRCQKCKTVFIYISVRWVSDCVSHLKLSRNRMLRLTKVRLSARRPTVLSFLL
jgi:hypothetical protein